MTQGELDAIMALKYSLPRLVEELQRMNKLKAFELKLSHGASVEDAIDKIMDRH